MVSLSPRNRFDAAAARTGLECRQSYCCEAPADCRLADIPAGSTEELRDVGTNEVIVQVAASTASLTLYGDVDNPWAFGAGCRLNVNVGAFSASITLNADGASTSDSITVGGLTISSAALCIEENGRVIGVATFSNGQSLAVELTGYNMGSNRNFAGVSGTNYGATTVDQIKTAARPECPPCPIPPDVNACDVCEVSGSSTPDAFQVTISGFAGTAGCPDGPCIDYNGTYIVPKFGLTPCLYFLQVPFTTPCVWTDAGFTNSVNVEGFCISVRIVETNPPANDRYLIEVRKVLYGTGQGGTEDLDCIVSGLLPNNNFQWLDPAAATNGNDPTVTPCNTYSRSNQPLAFNGSAWGWTPLNPPPFWQVCEDLAGGFANILMSVQAV